MADESDDLFIYLNTKGVYWCGGCTWSRDWHLAGRFTAAQRVEAGVAAEALRQELEIADDELKCRPCLIERRQIVDLVFLGRPSEIRAREEASRTAWAKELAPFMLPDTRR